MKNDLPVLTGTPMDFDRLYHRYRDATMRRALKLLDGDQLDAEDAMQDAWGHIAANLDRLHFENEALLSSYLMITIEGRARHIKEKKRRRRTLLFQGDMAGPSDDTSDDPVLYRLCEAETVDQIKAAIIRMKPHYREVLILSLLYDFPIDFIAKTLKIKRSTAYMRLQRGKSALAEILRKELQEQ